MRDVMLSGTLLTSLPVMTCFLFHRKHEVQQEVNLCDVRCLEFETADILPKSLSKADFFKGEGGPIKISYPLSKKSKYVRLKILTPDLQESNLILGKQFRARFRSVAPTESVCVVHFEDPSREPARVAIDSISVFLKQDQSVNTEASKLAFSLYPDLEEGGNTPIWMSGATSIFPSMSPKARSSRMPRGLKESLLQQPNLGSRETSAASSAPFTHMSSLDNTKALSAIPEASSLEAAVNELRATQHKRGKTEYTPNLFAAQMINFCELLNALGSGLSLRFIDLFLIEEYGLSPASILLIAFLECCCGACLTPAAHKMLLKTRKWGYHAKTAVVFLWGLALIFLGILCVPGVPLLAVVPAVVLMQSTNSCAKAYLRAKLVSYISNDRLAMYMLWDSLNDASQGGITMCGAMVIRLSGYQSCFCCTFAVMLVRLVVYGAYTAKRVTMSPKRGLSITDIEEGDVETLDSFGTVPAYWPNPDEQFGEPPNPLISRRNSYVEQPIDVEETEFSDYPIDRSTGPIAEE